MPALPGSMDLVTGVLRFTRVSLNTTGAQTAIATDLVNAVTGVAAF